MMQADSVTLHETALVEGDVRLGQGSFVEAFAYLGARDRFHPAAPIRIGRDSFIGSRCTVYGGVTCGDRLDISDQTTLFTDVETGNDCRIGPKAVIKNGTRLGDRVRVNANTFLERVVVGSNVFIGPGTIFADDLHPPCPRYGDCVPKTVVGDKVSIGAGVCIMPGITIGHHCQIYAGAVVIEDVEPYSVVAGSPARRIKDFRELTCAPGFFKRPFAWWD